MKRLAVTAILLAVPACVQFTPAARRDPVPDVAIAAPPAAVWDALAEVYTDLNLPIQNMDRSSWFLRSDEILFRPDSTSIRTFDCRSGMGRDGQGRSPVAGMYQVRATITTLLRENNGATSVRNRVNARAVTSDGGAIPCESTGALEDRVSSALRERVRR